MSLIYLIVIGLTITYSIAPMATSASAALGLARQSYQIEIFVLAPRRHNGCVAKAALRFLSYATLSQWGPVSMWFDRQ